MPPEPGEAMTLALDWRRRVREPAVVSALEAIYSLAAAEITSRGPACWASGRCCNFERAGHRLYVTGLETAYALENRGASVPPAPMTAGAAPALSLAQVADARARGGCPFQQDNLCGIHRVKPLGCRVYFCDLAAQEWQRDLSERLLAQVRALHDEHGIDYRYGEWRAMLDSFAQPEPA